MKFQKKHFVVLGALVLILGGGAFTFALYGERGVEKDVALSPRNIQEIFFAPQEGSSAVSEIIPPAEENSVVYEEPRLAIRATLRAGDDVFNLAVQENATLYDAMVDARRAGKLSFSGREYTGLGFFVTEIGALRDGDGGYLVYYVNGEQASVGVSSYVVRDGDVIEWRLE